MLFNSYFFILFFLPITLLIYFTFHKYNKSNFAKLFLTAMSLWFYAYFHTYYLFIILGSIVFNYAISKIILSNRGKKSFCRTFLVLGISGNVGLIFYYKYFDFFLENINSLFRTSIPLQHILLPLGISFFTFQQISYLVDSYRGETASYSFMDYALFVSFFPQLVAGPIVLHSELIPQFNDPSRRKINSEKFANGLYLFATGLFKKVLLADTLGNGVNFGYSNLTALSGMDTLLVSVMYTLQIYFDFSGYCDMACGIANMFQFDLPLNFNSPYKSTSITEFWQRWHITLGRFLRQYIYYPLGGNRKGTGRAMLNIMIIFIVSGIWHGANYTFILWGILHGIARVLHRLFQNVWQKIPKLFQWLSTFCFVNLTWILFRSDSLSQCSLFFKKLFGAWEGGISISPALIKNFDVIELTYIEDHIGFLSKLTSSVTGFNMWIILGICLIIALFTKNCHEKKFTPTPAKATGSIVLLVWPVISLSGLSTFLYFNF